MMPGKRILLDRLPSLLRAFGKDEGVDTIFVIADSDDRDCAQFLRELKGTAQQCGAEAKTQVRLAIEEMEAWLLGDHEAIRKAYPTGRFQRLKDYAPDSVCGSWELLAETIHPGGAAALQQEARIAVGRAKSRWAERIVPHIDIDRNRSQSFQGFVRALRRVRHT